MFIWEIMNTKIKLIFLLTATILLTPIGLYIYKFGFGLWDTTTSWSELGGYIGGIYAPILTFLTLLVLCVQIYLMQQQNNQALMQQQECILTEYLLELTNALTIKIDELDTKLFLEKLFKDKDLDEIDNIPCNSIYQVNEENHKIYSLWCGVNGCLNRIDALSKDQCGTAKNKVVIYVNPATCRTLDKYIYAFHLSCTKQGINIPLDPSNLHYWNSKKGA